MAEKTIEIEIKGYWPEVKKSGIPAQSGMYCVYECTYNTSENTVAIHKLIYIGESANVNDRIANHERYKDWKRHVGSGNVLCFSFGGVDSTDRARAEAAMINRHKPPENSEYVNSFPFDKTLMNLKGQIELLEHYFAVNRS